MAPRTTHSSLPTPGTQVPMRRIVISFSLAVVMVVAAVLYYTLQRAVITLDLAPADQVTETSLVTSADGSGADMAATVAATDVSGSKQFSASPSGQLADKATGAVTLINNNTAAQTLIATTRLLSPDNVLFRLKDTVTVPARGSLANVAVVADQPGDGSAIGPARFTIPGLKPTLREKIYAESSDPMRRTAKPGSKITAADFDTARKSLTDQLVPQALAKLREQLPLDQRQRTVVYAASTTKADSSVPAGADKSTFTYTVTVKVTAVFYDPGSLRDQALAKAQADVTDGRKVLTLEEQTLAVSVASADADKKTSTLKVKFMSKVAIADAEQAFRKTDLLGRTPDDVKNYFASVPGVKSVDVVLTPFWTKVVPTVESHITLQVKQ